MKNLYLNNKKTTFVSGILIGDTTLNPSSLNANIMPTPLLDGEKYVLTFTDEVDTEVVYVVASAGSPTTTSWTIQRAQEGTVAKAWSIGNKVELRVTAGMLNSLPQNTSTDVSTHINLNNYPSLRSTIDTAFKNIAGNRWTASASVGVFDVKILPAVSGAPTHVVVYLTAGTTGGSAPTALGYLAGTTDGDAVYFTIPVSATGVYSSEGDSFGPDAVASGNNQIALGSQTAVVGDEAVSLGALTTSFESSSAIGAKAEALHLGAVTLGRKAVSSHNSGLFTTSHPAKSAYLSRRTDISTGESNFNTNTTGYLWMPVIDVTGGYIWAGSVAWLEGDIVRPTVANGKQYVRYDSAYNQYSFPFNGSYSPTTGGASQPTWPTTAGNTVADTGASVWYCQNNVDNQITLPNNFFVEEVGIVLFSQSAAFTAQPFIAIGTIGSAGSLVANQQTTQLTGNNTVQKFTLTHPKIISSVRIDINTLATTASGDEQGLCQVYLKGFYISGW